MKEKTQCVICGKEFWKIRANGKYCSDECRREGRRQYFRERYNNNKEKQATYQKEWYQKHRERQKAYAREWIKDNPTYNRDRSRKIRGSQEHERSCIVCGKAFKTWLPHKMTCSDECKEINRKKRESARCRNRQKTPEQNHANYIKRRYGSEETYQKCLEEAEKEKERKRQERKRKKEEERQKRLIHGKCIVCGGDFKTFNPIQKTCCKKCGRKLQYARKAKRIPENQIIDKDITLDALYKRDSGVCYLCGKKCDWDDKDGFVIGANYPSIDHIIPVSRGGLHSWDNVRLAHFSCNLVKSDSMIDGAEKLIPSNAYEFKKETRPRKKKTIQYDLKHHIIAVYESTADAARKTGFKAKQIQNCARGEIETYRGYIWKYAI